MKKLSLQNVKHLTARVPGIHTVAKKAKAKLVDYIDFERAQREIYNVSSFYPTINDYYNQQKDIDSSDPLISILLPTYNTPEVYLRECIESIIVQSYANWELCIADDKSTDPKVLAVIKEYQAKDARIKLIEREKNGHISASTNSALSIATGEFVALMDHDDILWPNALYEMVKAIRTTPDVDHIYTDEDKIDGSGKVHSYPFLKPSLSPEFLESCNYITHFSCIRTSLMRDIGGFTIGCEGAQDWDLFIRIAEKTQKIVHIPKILYSWRIHESSTASDTDAKPYVYEAQKRLLQAHLERTGRTGAIEKGIIPQHRTIKYDIPTGAKLAVVIGYSSAPELDGLIQSLKAHDAGIQTDTYYLVDASDDKEQIRGIHKKYYEEETRFIIQSDKNNVQLSNIAENVDNEYIAYISDKTRLLSDGWGGLIVADLQRDGIGFIGPVILRRGTNDILSAGLGIGYGSDGYLNMLEGTSFDDQHYTRGLYAKSRRNVTAVSPLFYGFNAARVQLAENNVIESMIVNSVSGAIRNIYSPYIKIDSVSNATASIDRKYSSYEDPLLSPNFKHDSPFMEVRY